MKAVDSKYYDETYFRHSEGASCFFAGKIDSIYYSALTKMDLKGSAHVILDAGCGRGDLIKLLSREYSNSKIIGIDYSKDSVKIAKETLRDEQNIEILHADITFIPIKSNSVDYIFCLDIVEHLYPEQLNKAVKEMRRILKTGGKILIHTFPIKYMNEVSRIILKVLNRSSIGQLLHVNTQSSFSLKKILLENSLREIRIFLQARNNIAQENIDAANHYIKRALILFDKVYVIVTKCLFFSPIKDFIYSDIWATAVK